MSSSLGFPGSRLDFTLFDRPPTPPAAPTLGLKPSEAQIVLASQFGLTELMADNFAHLFRKPSGSLNTAGRALAAFEHLKRQTTYEKIAEQLEIKPASAYQVMLPVRKFVESATSLLIVSNGQDISLASRQTLAELEINAVKHALKMERKLHPLHRQQLSLRQTGQEFEINKRLHGLYLGYCRANNILPAGSEEPEIIPQDF